MTSLITSRLLASAASRSSFQAFNAVALERIGRAAGFEGAAAQNARASPGNLFRDLENLLARFYRAGAGHDDDLVAADAESIAEFDNRAFRAEGSSCKLIGRADAVNVLDPG